MVTSQSFIAGGSSARLTAKPKNKERRHNAYLQHMKAREALKRDFRHKRRREEDKDTRLRVERQARNKPSSIDKKRTWDEVDETGGGGLGLSVDIGSLKKRRVDYEGLPEPASIAKGGLTEEKLKKVEEEQVIDASGDESKVDKNADGEEEQDEELFSDEQEEDAISSSQEDADDDDLASILNDSDSDDPQTSSLSRGKAQQTTTTTTTARTSPPASTTSTTLSLIPDALAAKFPTLFATPTTIPKILITTSFSNPPHTAASTLTSLFPNSAYIPRQRHRYKSHHFSLREIARHATSRSFTTLLVLNGDHHKRQPGGLTAIHLPNGPTFHFSLKNWIPGKSLPGHGNPTEHDPELILNGFRTPLGLLTAHFFRSLFPHQPELGGRQVVTLHNQRDYIFVRRHRYIFRERRGGEKSVTEAEGGAKVKGVEDVKAGLQELGPRFTLKLRRVDRGVQRVSGEEWRWRAGMEKCRTKFQL